MTTPSLEIALDLNDEDEKNSLTEPVLGQNVPNPFSRETCIRFTIPRSERVTITILTSNGHLVDTLLDEYLPSGVHSVWWDAKNFASDYYFYRLRTRKATILKTMLHLK